MSFRIRGISTGAKKFVWEKKTAYNAVAFCFVLGRMRKTGSYLRNFLMEMRRKRRLTKKKTLIMRRPALKLDLYYAFIRYWDGKGRIPVVFVYFFFFCFTVDLGKTFWDGRTVRLGS